MWVHAFIVIKFLNEWANILEVMTCTIGTDCERSEENHETSFELPSRTGTYYNSIAQKKDFIQN
jgi:hypothetical protein